MTSNVWMPVYIGDYLADTMHLTAEQHGALLLLQMHQWRNGPLPNDDCQLATIARVKRSTWTKHVGPVVRKFFDVTDSGLSHTRLAQQKEKADEHAERKAEAGRAGAAKRWQADGTPTSKNYAVADGRPIAAALAKDMQLECPSSSSKEKQADAREVTSDRSSNGKLPSAAQLRKPHNPYANDPPKLWSSLAARWEGNGSNAEMKPVRGACYINEIGQAVCEAAGFRPDWRGDWSPLCSWLDDGFTGDVIIRAITDVARRASYTPPQTLMYFDARLRESAQQPP